MEALSYFPANFNSFLFGFFRKSIAPGLILIASSSSAPAKACITQGFHLTADISGTLGKSFGKNLTLALL